MCPLRTHTWEATQTEESPWTQVPAPSDSTAVCCLFKQVSLAVGGGALAQTPVSNKAKLKHSAPGLVLITVIRINIFPGWEREHNLKEEIIESSKADYK